MKYNLIWWLIPTLIFSLFITKCQYAQDSDEKLVTEAFKLASSSESIPEIVDKIGHKFMGSPYVGHTLESNKEELVVNLREFDCTTFVESVLSITKSIINNNKSIKSFEENLTKIRYRNGNLNGYSSRLHYFSEWLINNEEKGILKIITKELGGEFFNKEINFMSKNHSKYKQLSNSDLLIQITEIERALNKKSHYFIPKSKMESTIDKIKTGDIIAFTTNIEGLDVVHVGFAHKTNEKVKLMHASNGKEKKVIISDQTLQEYIAEKKWMTGIMIARLNQ